MVNKIVLVLLASVFSVSAAAGAVSSTIYADSTRYDFDLAAGAEVRTSSQASGQGPELLVDGKTDKGFYSSINSGKVPETDHEEWVSVKLTKTQPINEIWIYPVQTEIHEGFPLNFKLQVSKDGLTWIDVTHVTEHPLPVTAMPEIFSFEPMEASYVRFYAENLRPISNKWTDFKDVYLLRLAKMEVYLRSSQIRSVLLDKYFSISGMDTEMKVSVATDQIPLGTTVWAALEKPDGVPLSSSIKESGTISANKCDISLSLPAALEAGDYQVKVMSKVAGKELSLLSKIYKVAPLGNRTFYVSNSEGSDANDGLTEAKPIQSLSRASALELLPGDKLLLKKGDIWENESLVPQGSGTTESPILLSSYGTGNRKPHIKPNYGEYYGIRIVNAAGYEISDMEVSHVMGGIVVWQEDSYNQRYIKIKNCYLHDMTDQGRHIPPGIPDLLYGMGISIAGSDNYGGRTLISDIFIEDCEIDLCDVGIEVIGRDHDDTGAWTRHGHDKISRFAFMNVNIKNSNIRRSYRSGGVMLYCITGGKSEHLLIDQTGYNGIGMWWGVCAFQTARVSDYLIENCTFSNTIKGSSPDGQGFDWEADTHNVIVRKCRFINNEGPATLNYGESWPGENSGCVLDSCYIEGNNWIDDAEEDYYKRVFGLNRNRPANNGIVKNCEIRLRSNDQHFWTFPLVFDESNKVYNAEGKLIYGGLPRNNPFFADDFSGDLSFWENNTNATIVNGAVKINNIQAIYVKQTAGLTNYFSEAHFNFTKEGGAGIIFGLKDSATYYLLETNVKSSMMSESLLYKVNKGAKTILKRMESHGLRPHTAFSVRVEVKGKELAIYVQGSLMGLYTTKDDVIGASGLYMDETGICTMDEFSVHPL